MSERLSVKQWWVSEYVRCLEERTGRLADDEVANALARASVASLAERIAIRAQALPMAKSIEIEMQHFGSALRGCVAIGVLIGLLAGLGAGLAAAGQREIDVLTALLTILALPTLTLLIWIGLIVWPKRDEITGPMAHAFLWLSRSLHRLLGPPDQEGCVAKVMLSMLATPYGRWGLSVFTHLVWLSYLSSALLLLWVQLIVSQYDLGWGTTLLSESTALELLTLLACLPEWLGWMPPQSEQWLAQGQLGVAPEAVRMPMAVFLLSLIVAYGMLPRLLLLGLSVWMWRRMRHVMCLDLSQPGYARLKGLLLDPQRTEPVADQRRVTQARPLRRSLAHGQGVYFLSIEMDTSPAIQPSARGSVTDLGRVEGREDRVRVLAALSSNPTPARCLVIALQARRSPDQGLIELINRLADAAGGALLIVLTDIEGLKAWGVDEASRWEEWSWMGQQTGGRVIRPEELKQALDEVIV